MAEKKHSPFLLLDILQRHTDEEHILTASQLISLLAEEFGVIIERRTLYSNIRILRQAGYEISGYDENGTGYYLVTRQFDKSEVLMLCNAIHSSHFISSKQSDELIKRILHTLSNSQSREFRSQVYLPNRKKTENKQLLYNIGIVSEAIRDRKQISFIYQRYDKDKKLVPRRKEPYVMEPRFIVYADERPYVIVTSRKYPAFSHYRLDRMKDTKILTEPSVPLNRNRIQEAYQYASNKLFMFAGQNISAVLRCHISILDQMIDLFGLELSTSPQDDDHVVIRIQANRDGILFLGQQYMDAMEILEPQDLREEMIKRMEDRLKAYKMLEK
jgi:predicted DNA-binding transcriptional regulator YafY